MCMVLRPLPILCIVKVIYVLSRLFYGASDFLFASILFTNNRLVPLQLNRYILKLCDN